MPPRTFKPSARKGTRTARRSKPVKKSPTPVRIVHAKKQRPKTFNTNIGLPLEKKTKLTYYETIGLTSTSGIVSKHTFNLADIFDPDFSGAGHQPYGHDQWANLYKKYVVSSAKITVKWSNIATNNIGHNVFVLLDKDNVVDGNLDTRQEMTRGVGNATLLPNSNNTKTTTGYYSPKTFFAIKDVMDDHQLKASLGASPTLPAYCVIGIQPIDQVTTSSAIIYGEVRIEYNVTLFDPVQVAGS